MVAVVRKMLLARAGSNFSAFKIRGIKKLKVEDTMAFKIKAAMTMRDKLRIVHDSSTESHYIVTVR